MSLRELMRTDLPFNRKERFFTGTIFPMIVCYDGFKYFDRFTALIPNYQWQPINISSDKANIQFFTEYSLVESIVDIDNQRFPSPPTSRDTPDMMILIKGERKVLIALEAKMFLAPAPTALERQMWRQAEILNYLREKLAIDDVYHLAIVPEQWRLNPAVFPFGVMTWDALYEAFHEVMPNDYFLEIIHIALTDYEKYVSKPGKNSEGKLSGQAIYEGYTNDVLEIDIMGRNGGLTGSLLNEDIATDQWRIQLYEISSSEEPPNSNWFYVSDFIARIESSST